MQIVRTGITKKMGGTPEVVLEAQMQGVSGIGAAAIVTAALSLLPTIIEKISGLFKSEKFKAALANINFEKLKEPLSRVAQNVAQRFKGEKKSAPVARVTPPPMAETQPLVFDQTNIQTSKPTPGTETQGGGDPVPKKNFFSNPLNLALSAAAAYVIFK